MKKKKKVLSLVLALGLCFSTLSSPITYADEDPNITGSTTETVTEEKTNTDVDYQILTEDELAILGNSDEVTDTVTEVTDVEEVTDEVVEEDTSTIDNTTTEVIASDGDSPIDTEEPTTVEEKTTEVAEPVEIDANTLNYRLIVSVNDESILTDGYVISSYEGVYLIGYENDSDRENGYNFYKDKVEFVEKDDAVFELSDEEQTEDVEVVNQDDALTTLNEIDTTPNYSDYIALIDTGANADINVSVVGDDTSDTNGHGTKMLKYIKEEAPKAKVISIKAFDGKSSNVSNIYAAIKLAIEYKVSIINLSFVGVDMESNSIIKDVINEAIDNGITVVGASGNYNSDASHYVPGCIDKAIVVGACDENGEKISTSNYGKTVDFNVVATSTSEASARMSGMLVSGGASKIFVNNYTDYDDKFVYINDFQLAHNWAYNGTYGQNNNTYYIENVGQYNGNYKYMLKYTSNNAQYQTGVLDDEGFNVVCIDPNCAAGQTGYRMDVFDPVELLNADSGLTPTQIKNIFYYALTEVKWGDGDGGNGSHFDIFADIFMKYWYGRTSTPRLLPGHSDRIPGPGDWHYDRATEIINTYKNKSIPENKTINVYYIRNDCDTGSNYDYQDFLTWKIADVPLKDYYVAVKKVDVTRTDNSNNASLTNNITFSIKVNNEVKKIEGYTACVYTGFYQDITSSNGSYSNISARDTDSQTRFKNLTNNYTNNNNYGDGIAIVYLGKFTSAPTVQVAEKWNTNDTECQRKYQLNSVEVVHENKRVTVPVSEFKGVNGNYISVTPYTSAVDAVKNANSFLYENQENKPTAKNMLYITKSDPDGNPIVGAKFNVKKPDGSTVELTTQYYGSKTDIAYAYLNNLPDGQYTITETYVPSPYKMDSKPKTVTLKDTSVYLLHNDYNIADKTNTNVNYYNNLSLSYVYNEDWYRDKGFGSSRSDIQFKQTATKEQLFNHFVRNGMSEGRQSTECFSWSEYKNRYSDLANAFGDTTMNYYLHFAKDGSSEGRFPRSATWVKNNNGIHGSGSGIVIYNAINPIDERDYYVVLRKSDINSENSLRGVIYSIEVTNHDGDEDVVYTTKANADGSYTYTSGNCIYTGYYQYLTYNTNKTITVKGYTTARDNIKDVNGNTLDPEIGYAVVYLGKFTQAPTVRVAEVWGKGVQQADENWHDDVRGDWAWSYPKDVVSYSNFTQGLATPTRVYASQYAINNNFISIGVTTTLDDRLTAEFGRNEANKNKNRYRQLTNTGTIPVSIKKSVQANCANFVKNNPNYSLEGTKYGLYTNKTDAQNNTNPLCIYTLNANGNIASISNVRNGYLYSSTTNRLIIQGTQIPITDVNPKGSLKIYYKELTAGKGYIINSFNPDHDYIELTTEQLSTTQTISVTDKPKGDPLRISIHKYDLYTEEPVFEKSGEYSLKIKCVFYKADASDTTISNKFLNKTFTEADYTDKYTKTYTVEFDTNNGYRLNINPTDFSQYFTVYDIPQFPFGYLTIEEIQAPSGFDVSKLKMTLNSGGTHVDMQDSPTIRFISDTDVRYSKKNNTWGTLNGTTTMSIYDYNGWNPTISTTMNTSTNSKIGVLKTNETAKDTIIFKNVPKGIEFQLVGELLDVTNNKAEIDRQTINVTSSGVSSQTKTITYTYDSNGLAGHKLSSKITMYVNGEAITIHNANLNDKNETIYYPSVKTTAKSANTGTKLMAYGSTVTLVDDIDFTNLVCGKTYQIKGTVQKRKADGTNDGILTINGNEVSETLTIVVSADGTVTATDSAGESATVKNVTKTNNNETVSGTVRMTFKFNSTALEGITTTVFEDLYYNNIKVCSHTNIEDKDQQVHFMKIRTNFTDDDTNDEVAVRKTNATVTDEIVFEKVPFGSTITFNGTLKDKATNSDFKISGNSVTTTGIFTINDNGTQTSYSGSIVSIKNITVDNNTKCVSGSLYIQYTYDSTNIGNKTLVSFIKATVENPNATPTTKTVALHEKINDLKETIYYTDIHTNANDINTKTNVATLGQTTIVDTVTLDNLVWDKTYVLTGTIHKKKINTNGTVTDLGILKQNNKDVKITSTITIDANGNITATNASNIQFTKNADDKTTSGTLDLSFSVNTSELKGQDVVVFEDLKHNNITISMHNEISDIGQTIHVPDGGTTAMDDLTKDEVGTVKENEDVTLIDTVALTNIAFGHTYKLKGIIMDKATGESLKINGQTIISEATFTVDNSGKVTPSNAVNKVTNRVVSDVNNDGTNDVVSFKIALPFTMSSKDLYNKDIVVYENGYFVKADGDVEIFKENDINNLGQTVHFPEVRTLATDDTYEKHVGTVSERSTLTEKAFLSNLVYGKDYELVATLVNQVTGEDLEVNGTKIQKKVTLSISNNGTVTAKDKTDNTIVYETTDKVTYASDKTLDVTVIIPFEYDSSVVGGQTTVVYEDLIHNNITVRTHHDKDDTDQQVHYYKLNITKEGLDNAIEATFKAEHNGNAVKFVKVSDGVYNILITNDNTAKYVTEINPDELGNITINGFDVGDYTFTETRTEKGKNLLSKDFTITFTPTSDTDGKLKEVVLTTDDKQSTLSLDEPMVELEPNTVNVTINNSPTFKLNTGGNGTNGYYIIAILLMLCACVVFIIKRKRVR